MSRIAPVFERRIYFSIVWIALLAVLVTLIYSQVQKAENSFLEIDERTT